MANINDIVQASDFPKKLWLKQILIASSKYDPIFRTAGNQIVAPGVEKSQWDNTIKESLKALYRFVMDFEKWNPQTWEAIDAAFDVCSNHITYILYDKAQDFYEATTPDRSQLILAVVTLIYNLGKKVDDTAASSMERKILFDYDWGRKLAKVGLLKSGIQALKSDKPKKPTNDNADDLNVNLGGQPKYNKTRGHTSSNPKSSRQKRKDRQYYVHDNPLSQYVRDLIGMPNSPIAMTGENGHIFAIEQETDSLSSSKTPMALIMPLTNVAHPDTDRRTSVDATGKRKNKIRISASVDSPQTFIAYFNTEKEAQDMLDKILATSYVPYRIDPNADPSKLRIVAYNIVSRDTNLTQKEWDKFKRLFYQVDTDLGPVWIMAQHLNEAFMKNHEININEVLEEADKDKATSAEKYSYYYDFDAYEEAFEKEF